MRKLLVFVAGVLAVAALPSCGMIGSRDALVFEPSDHEARIAAVLAAPDRFEGDAERDGPRHTATVLSFSRVEPGDRVFELGSGGGYMSRILAAFVAPDGVAIVQDPQEWMDDYPELVDTAQAMESAYPNLDHQVMDFDALDGEAGSFDVVVIALIYHDTVWMGVDRAAMNAQAYALLRPGGLYLVVDHHAEPGSGVRDVETLHRIDPAVVRTEVAAAGFALIDETDALENPDDDLTLNVFDPDIQGRTSQFAYLFRKPS